MPVSLTSDNAPNWFWPAVFFCVAALLSFEMLFLRYPGLQQDEVLFVRPFLRHDTPLYAWHIGVLQVPVMSMDYLGALKSWLYWPIFRVWPPGVWSIRLPACAISAGTLVVFAAVVRRTAGPTVAVLACALLASDSSFILTNVFDWGPVSLLLLGTIAILALGQRVFASGRGGGLAAGALVAGLSLWYKAAFIFPLVGIVASFTVFNWRSLAGISRREWGIAAASFLIGISPLLAFNLSRSGATLTAASGLEAAPAAEKLRMLQRTLDGRALEHYMFRSKVNEKLELQGAPLPDLVMGWYRDSRFGPGSGLFLSLLLSLPAFPFLRASPLYRPLQFAWPAFLVSTAFMLGFRDAGAGPHHTVLLYPAPHFIVAASAAGLAQLRPRFRGFAIVAIALAIASIGASNLWLVRNYYRAARHNGFSVYWSDGLPELARAVRAKGMPATFLDWGIEDGVRIESGDRVNVMDDRTPRAGILYVGHCPGYVVDAAAAQRFDRATNVAHMVRNNEVTVRDREGHPVFCLFSLQ